MKGKIKVIPCELKEIDDEQRSFLAVASTEDIDRDNDRLMADGWNLTDFMKNPVVPWAHRYGEPPVARAEAAWVENGRLMFRPKFATADEYPFADTIFKLYKGGYLRSFSVRFMPKRYKVVEREKGRRGYDYIEQDLWEISACTVPSNPNALVEARNKGVINDAHFERLADPDPGDGEAPDIGARLDAIEAKLAEVSAICGTIVEKIETIAETAAPPFPLKSMEEKLDELLALQTRTPAAGDETETLIDAETRTPDAEIQDDWAVLTREDLAKIVQSGADRMAEKVGDTVDNRIRYHLGKVD